MLKIYCTDIASILGLNNYETAWMLLEKKIENKYKFLGNKYTEHGNKYEKAAIRRYEMQNNVEVEKNNLYCEHPQYKWLTGVVDGKCDNKIVEIKCPWTKKRNLTEKDIPSHYWVQCQAYMNILEIDETDYVEYYIEPGSDTDGKSGDMSIVTIKRDKNWWNNKEIKILNFYTELLHWYSIGNLNQHPIRLLEKEWNNDFFIAKT